MFFVPLFGTQQIMREKWINIGLEEDELKPYVECAQDVLDPIRIGNNKTKTRVDLIVEASLTIVIMHACRSHHALILCLLYMYIL